MATITITLEIDGYQSDAEHVVDSLLDAGFLQDAINDHDADAGPLHVTAATIYKPLPACAASMGCLCAGHARGAPASAVCDTTE
jgi:hypothetical protein